MLLFQSFKNKLTQKMLSEIGKFLKNLFKLKNTPSCEFFDKVMNVLNWQQLKFEETFFVLANRTESIEQ
jgi:hypothetical protein